MHRIVAGNPAAFAPRDNVHNMNARFRSIDRYLIRDVSQHRLELYFNQF